MKIKEVAVFWRYFVLVLAPILLLPIILQNDSKEARCGYTLCLVALLWATEALPLPATSLLPVVLLPLFGILTTQEVSQQYFNNANMMFLGAMGVAAAVERSGLHRRVALIVLLGLGAGRRSLLFAFMVTTALLSCFICNTATTAMMVPVLAQVMDQLHEDQGEEEIKRKENKRKYQTEKVMFYLGIAYSANLGGTGTLTASAPNIVLKGFMSELYGPDQNDLNYATWMAYSIPALVVGLIATWGWLLVLFKGCSGKGDGRRIKAVLRSKYNELGGLSFKEVAVGFCFLFLILAWFFQEPGFIQGWGDYFQVERDGKTHGAVDEATPATLVLLLLFIIPSHLNFYPFVDKNSSCTANQLPPPLLDWKTLTTFFPWGLLLLRGGGFALAEASIVSGLSTWFGVQLSSLSSFSPWILLTITTFITSITTELISNAATANILLPILAELASATKTNPIYFLLPTTLSCCNAFMLPVAAPPNAIVYQASGMDTRQMIKAGVVVNLFTLFISMVAINTYGLYIFDLNTFPEWANNTIINNTAQSFQILHF